MKNVIKNITVKIPSFEQNKPVEIENAVNREDIIRLAKILNKLDEEQELIIKDYSCDKS